MPIMPPEAEDEEEEEDDDVLASPTVVVVPIVEVPLPPPLLFELVDVVDVVIPTPPLPWLETEKWSTVRPPHSSPAATV
jgi:hypothetical protein